MTPREARAAAAARWKPADVRCLLVAEAPPEKPDRYFYFEHVATQDSLFRHVAQVILGDPGTRADKPDRLAALRGRGVFLIDLSLDPLPKTGQKSVLNAAVPGLIDRCRALDPAHIILIKATVHDAAYQPLGHAGLPVNSARIPFPGSGQQQRFLRQFREAFSRADAIQNR